MSRMGTPQTGSPSHLQRGKLSKKENTKCKEKVKLFEIFRGETKTIGASVYVVESKFNNCIAGIDRIDQSWRQGGGRESSRPIGELEDQALGSRTHPTWTETGNGDGKTRWQSESKP